MDTNIQEHRELLLLSTIYSNWPHSWQKDLIILSPILFYQLDAHTCLTVGRRISFDHLLNLCQLDAHTGFIVRRKISFSLPHTLCCQIDAHTGLTIGRRVSSYVNNPVSCVCWDKFTGAAKCRSSRENVSTTQQFETLPLYLWMDNLRILMPDFHFYYKDI